MQNDSNDNCLEHNVVNFLRRVYRKQPVLLRADLDGTIFPYDLLTSCLQHKSCRLNQTYHIFPTVAHNTKNGVGF